MLKFKDLLLMSKKGATYGVDALIGVVVLIILIAALVPSALTSIFNTSLYTGVPTWVSTTLGSLAVVAVIYILLKAGKK